MKFSTALRASAAALLLSATSAFAAPLSLNAANPTVTFNFSGSVPGNVDQLVFVIQDPFKPSAEPHRADISFHTELDGVGSGLAGAPNSIATFQGYNFGAGDLIIGTDLRPVDPGFLDGQFSIVVKWVAGDFTIDAVAIMYDYEPQVVREVGRLLPQSTVPEPSSLALIGAALLAGVWTRRRVGARG